MAAPSVQREEGARLATLETRVGGIEDSLKSLIAELKSKGAINWMPIGILVTVLGMIGSGGFLIIDRSQARLESALLKIETKTDQFVPRVDLDKRLEVSGQRRDDAQRRTDDRIERIERDIEKTERLIVPRGEHEQMWAGQRQRDGDLQRQIDEQRKGLGELNTPRDTIQSLQRRLEELERRGRPP